MVNSQRKSKFIPKKKEQRFILNRGSLCAICPVCVPGVTGTAHKYRIVVRKVQPSVSAVTLYAAILLPGWLSLPVLVTYFTYEEDA